MNNTYCNRQIKMTDGLQCNSNQDNVKNQVSMVYHFNNEYIFIKFKKKKNMKYILTEHIEMAERINIKFKESLSLMY